MQNVSPDIKLFADAVNKSVSIVLSRADRSDKRFVEAMAIKAEFFPRSDVPGFACQLERAIKLGLVRALDDGDSLWLIKAA